MVAIPERETTRPLSWSRAFFSDAVTVIWPEARCPDTRGKANIQAATSEGLLLANSGHHVTVGRGPAILFEADIK